MRDIRKWPEAEASYRSAITVQDRLVADFPRMPEYRAGLAGNYFNLGLLLAGLGKRPESEAAYSTALSIREKLATDFPAVPTYRRDLAASHNTLGIMLAERGKGPEAEAAYRASLTIRETLAADFPAVVEYAVELSSSYCNLGNLLGNGDAQAGLAWHTKAIARLAPIVAANERLVTARQFLCVSYWGRARDLTLLGRYAEALSDWDAALKFDDGPARLELRSGRVDCLARLGRAVNAVCEASGLAADKTATLSTIYNCACAVSLASAAANNPAADRHAALAVELLRQAIAKGFSNIPHLLADPDLASLRGRADYAALLWDLADMPLPAH